MTFHYRYFQIVNLIILYYNRRIKGLSLHTFTYKPTVNNKNLIKEEITAREYELPSKEIQSKITKQE